MNPATKLIQEATTLLRREWEEHGAPSKIAIVVRQADEVVMTIIPAGNGADDILPRDMVRQMPGLSKRVRRILEIARPLNAMPVLGVTINGDGSMDSATAVLG